MAHSHGHEIKNYNRAFAIGIGLNVIFVMLEAGYGFIAGSLALLADAGHNLSDVFSLLLAWGGSYLATRSPTGNRTYGFRRATIMASLLSAILLLLALGSISWEAIGRLANPQPVDAQLVMLVAAIGVIINGATALLFVSGQQDLNIRAAYLHMAADAGISLGVVVAGVAIIFSGWYWLDPLISLVIVAVILVGTWKLLRESINLSIDAVPGDIDIADIQSYLSGFKAVLDSHDLHVWALSTNETALTVHLVVDARLAGEDFLHTLQRGLQHDFHIAHSTIQLENPAEAACCALNRQACV